MATSLLAQVRSIAKKAAKSGTGWHVRKGGAIACKDKRCTLAAIMFKQTEPMRKIQEEFNALLEKADEVANGKMHLNFSPGDEVYDDTQVYNVDGWPGEDEAAEALGLDTKLSTLVIDANDNSKVTLTLRVKDARAEAEQEKQAGYIGRLDEYEDFEGKTIKDHERALKARIILEEELLGKKSR